MINKYNNVPLYSQLKSLIVERIENSEYPEGTKIPSEEEFCEIYKISRPTVRQAISELTSSGHLYKEKGKGTFVAKSKASIDIKNYTGFTDSILDSQIPGQKNVILLKTVDSIVNRKLGEVFNINTNLKVDFAEISYLTVVGSEILSLNVSFIPLNFFPAIIQDIKDKKPSYDILRGKYPFIPVKSKGTLEVVFSDLDDAQHLQVQTGQPLLKIDNILYSKAGQAVEYIISKYRADKCKLTFENNK